MPFSARWWTRRRSSTTPSQSTPFCRQLPQGITLDSNFSLNELIGLAVAIPEHQRESADSDVHTPDDRSDEFDSSAMCSLLRNHSAQQQLFAQIFGNELRAPTNPPPNEALQTPQPPTVATTVPATSTTTTAPKKSTVAPTTTTTNPTLTQPNFDPRPCSPT